MESPKMKRGGNLMQIPRRVNSLRICNPKSYLGADIVSVAVVFLAFFLCAFLVALVAVSFWANKTAVPDRSERLRAAIIIFFI